MGQPYQLPLVGLLLFALIPSQRCEICKVSKENYFRLSPLMRTLINSKHNKVVQDANILLSLRLTGFQNVSLDQELIQELKGSVRKSGANLTSGCLALIMLALGACQNPNKAFRYEPNLIGHLESKFQAEIKNIENYGNPLTNYYQLSMDVLALCLFNGSYSVTEVSQLLSPKNKTYYFGDQFSVDTASMAVLALTCVKNSVTNGQMESIITSHIESLVKQILSEKKGGLIGNIYSTGGAMQALFVSSDYYNKREWDCQKTQDAILSEIPQGVFSLPIAAAQVLPALMGKTYLDINRDSPCVYSSGDFHISTQEPLPPTPTQSASDILVRYSVVINETYSTSVTVPTGSVFLDVMEAAKKINETVFRFKVVDSSWGPYVTSVQGLTANSNERRYWELLSEGKPLSQGVGSYVVHDGENLEVRWSTY
ncbi:transcobalamin-1 [Erinaceus europaeus]|uniref:Transcobalamin-1 n=1 Tax=Erinaceus europaeus TaxID=9365 RepID=A0A1S2ZI25_ERIEU|nr:transcobalamin-1 [Erinaceus europaeus]